MVYLMYGISLVKFCRREVVCTSLLCFIHGEKKDNDWS